MKQKHVAKKWVSALVRFAVLGLLLYFGFHDHYAQIRDSLRSVGVGGFCLLMGAGLVVQLFDAGAVWVVIRPQLTGFSYRQALEYSCVGAFSNLVTAGVGTFPMQGYYLHRCGMMPGAGVGVATLSYTLHKTAMLCCGAVLFVLEREMLDGRDPALRGLSGLGFGICTGIIVFLLLFCTWDRLRRGIHFLLAKLPDTPAWQQRKERLMRNLDALYQGSRGLFHCPRRVVAAVALHSVKLLWMDAVPLLGLALLGLPMMPPGRVMALTALCFLLAGACPSAGGMGPMELAFVLLFSAEIGQAEASALMILFRCGTYFFPFLISAVVALYALQKLRKGDEKASS